MTTRVTRGLALFTAVRTRSTGHWLIGVTEATEQETAGKSSTNRVGESSIRLTDDG